MELQQGLSRRLLESEGRGGELPTAPARLSAARELPAIATARRPRQSPKRADAGAPVLVPPNGERSAVVVSCAKRSDVILVGGAASREKGRGL